MKIKTTPIFDKLLKKLHKNQIEDLEKAIKEILDNPNIGEEKLGDLTGIRVYKFKMVKQLTLLSYTIINEEIILTLSFGSHQNFYEDLKRYLKSIKSIDFSDYI